MPEQQNWQRKNQGPKATPEQVRILGNIRYRVPKDVTPKGLSKDADKTRKFKTQIAVDKDFGGKKSVLFLIDHIETDDLIKKMVLGGDTTRVVWCNLLRLTMDYAGRVDPKFDGRGYKFAFVNFNYFKTYGLNEQQEEKAYVKYFKPRAEDLIAKLKPETVVIVGDDAAMHMLDLGNYAAFKRGRVYERKFGKHTCKVVTTLGLRNLYSTQEQKDGGDLKKNVELSNLFGVVSRCMMPAFVGKQPFDISHIKVKPKLVKTMAEFKKMIRKLRKAPYFAFDCETDNLSVTANRILTAQFAVTETFGWVLPMYHMDAPWSAAELKYITKQLRRLFLNYEKKGYKKGCRYIIGQNIKFDLRIARACLKVPFIGAPVWDVMEGEHKLDENEKMLSRMNPKGKVWGLDVTTAKYGNDFYFLNEVGKDNRNELGSRHLDKAEQAYCFDPQTLVLTTKGKVPISTIVSEPEKHTVISYNHTTQQCEEKPVVAGFAFETKKRKVRVHHATGSVVVTEDHEFWSITRNMYVQACELQPDEEVLVADTAGKPL